MNIVFEISNCAPPDWELYREAAVLESSFLQSTIWAYVKRHISHDRAHFLRLYSQKELSAQALILQCWPKTAKRRTSLLPTLTCFDGPSIFTSTNEGVVLDHFLRNLIFLSRRNFASSIEITFPRASRFANNAETRSLFLRHGFTSTKWATFLIDLKSDERTLQQNLHKAARKNLRRCMDLGVVVRELKGENASMEYGRYYATIESQVGRHAPEPHAVFAETALQHVYRYYVAENASGDVLGCLAMYIMNGLATEIASTLSPEAFAKKIPAQDALHWHLICEAKKTGCRYFDLAGVNPKPETPKEQGIHRFKEKWGGKYVEYDRYTRTNTLCYAVSCGFQGMSKILSWFSR